MNSWRLFQTHSRVDGEVESRGDQSWQCAKEASPVEPESIALVGPVDRQASEVQHVAQDDPQAGAHPIHTMSHTLEH